MYFLVPVYANCNFNCVSMRIIYYDFEPYATKIIIIIWDELIFTVMKLYNFNA